MAGVPRQCRNEPRLGQPRRRSGGREAQTPRHPREPRVSGTPPQRPLTQGSKQISPCKPRERNQATTNGHEIPEFITDPGIASGTGGVGESRPGRRDPGGAQAGADTSRQPVRGKSQSKSQSTFRQDRRKGDGENKTGGHAEDNNNGGGQRRMRRSRTKKN